MSEQEEKLPRLSYELIRWLDEAVPSPQYPLSFLRGEKGLAPEDLQRLSFIAGQRHMVDVLVFEMNEEIGADEDGDPTDSSELRFVRLLPEDGHVDSTSVSHVIDVEMDTTK